ncbi:MAG: OB-fold nucleic acid binding domain, partial [Verrucomicrobiota bacterium]
MSESAPLSVTELAAVLKGHVAAMGFFEVAGEVSGHKHYAASGHHYFTLKDEASTVS